GGRNDASGAKKARYRGGSGRGVSEVGGVLWPVSRGAARPLGDGGRYCLVRALGRFGASPEIRRKGRHPRNRQRTDALAAHWRCAGHWCVVVDSRRHDAKIGDGTALVVKRKAHQ